MNDAAGARDSQAPAAAKGEKDMKLNKVWALYYSATGTTGKVAATIGSELEAQLGLPLEEVRFTKPAEREKEYTFTENDLVVVGTPTYAGRMPNKILPDFREKLAGGGALAVPVVLFGNRSYDNSLAELCAVLERNGFHTVAAGAFVGRHAFTDELAYGRPGWSDLFEAKTFAKKIADKVKTLSAIPGAGEGPRGPGRALLRSQGDRRSACQFPESQAQDAACQMHQLRRLRPGVPHGGHRPAGCIQRARDLHQVSGLRPQMHQGGQVF